MKHNINILVIFSVILLIVSQSCKKDEDIVKSTNFYSKVKTARLTSDLTSAEVEEELNNFLANIETPDSAEAMNYEEVAEYIEGALNYKYVVFDYSKCADYKSFNSSISISTDGEGLIPMSDISNYYNEILDDWREKYNSINDDIKTPIAFDIYQISTTEIRYKMVVGFGELDLSLYDENFVIPPGTHWDVASNLISAMMAAHLNNTNIAFLNPYGANSRVFYTNTGSQTNFNPFNYLNSNDPIQGDFYLDYQMFYTHQDEPGLPPQNYHQYLDAVELNYYSNSFFTFCVNYINSLNNVNTVMANTYLSDDYSGYYSNPVMVIHDPKIEYGYRYYTNTAASTL